MYLKSKGRGSIGLELCLFGFSQLYCMPPESNHLNLSSLFLKIIVYICTEYLCRQGLALLFLSVIANIEHSEVLTSFVTFVCKVIQMMTNTMEKFKIFMLC